MKRFLALLLCAILALGCISGVLAEDEKTVLTIWIAMDLRIEDYNTNWQTLWLEEQLGDVDLQFIPQASDGYAAKVNTALTAGSISDLPDIILGSMTDANVYNWALQGTIVPLTEYYKNDELNANIREAIERTGTDFTQMITAPDGEIYGFANLNQSYYNEHCDKMWLYTPWLEQLNLETPTTTDELYNVLKTIVESDPNGNGKKDEVGIFGTYGSTEMFDNWFGFIMNAFVYAGDSQLRTVNDGVVGLAYTTEEWREGLRFIKKMYDDGIIAPECFTADTATCDAMYNMEDVVCATIPYAAPDRVNDTEIESGYTHILPVKGPNGVQLASYRPSTPNIQMVVTANCKNPEAAFRFGDACSSEIIGIAQRFGAQGIEWDFATDVEDTSKYVASIASFPISIIVYHDGEFWGGSNVGNASWRQKGPMIRQYAIASGMGVDPATVDLPSLKLGEAAVAYQTCGYNPAEVIPKVILSEEEMDFTAQYESELKRFAFEQSAAFITGTLDLDADWDAFQDELKNLECEQYVEIMQNVYDRMYK